MPVESPRGPASPPDAEAWGERLREAGLRITAGRVATLTYVDAHPHASVADIHAALGRVLPSVSAQSVHNITHDLTERGMLRRISLPDATSALFETRTDDNHHHAQCVACGRVVDVDCVVGEAPCLTPQHGHGMRLLEAAITFRGVCDACDRDRGRDRGAPASGRQASADHRPHHDSA